MTKMTQAGVRRLALSLPETEEGAHFGRADLRVRKKIFAGLPKDGRTVNLKTTPVNLDALVSQDPATFRDVWDGRWVGVDLSRVRASVLRDLVVEAWRLAAPKRLAELQGKVKEGPEKLGRRGR